MARKTDGQRTRGEGMKRISLGHVEIESLILYIQRAAPDTYPDAYDAYPDAYPDAYTE